MTSSFWVRIRILSREVGYLFLVSVRLKSTRQPINTITFYLRDISTPLVGVAFKHIDQNVKTVNSDSLILLLLCLASVDNTFGCSMLNWPWHSKQCSVAPELSHFPFMLSWWCSIVMVNTFFFVSPMYSAFEWTRRKVSRLDNSRWICKQATIKLSLG